MKNTIAERIAEFLQGYLPFSHLNFNELVEIAKDCHIIDLEKNKILFKINDKLHDCFYVVNTGTIHLTVIADAEETLLNKCYAGDIFGLRPFFAKNNYMMTARARENSILFAIPIKTFKPYVAKNNEVLDFLLESFATNTRNSLDKDNKTKLISDSVYNEQQNEANYFQTLTFNKSPIIAITTTPIIEIAQTMTNAMQECIIITHNSYPVGLVTDADFRAKVATGRNNISEPISKIMETNIVTVNETISVAEAQLLLLKNNASHLLVTYDGTENSEIKGIISEHDLIVSQANSPGILIKEIKTALKIDDLIYLRQRLTDLIQTSISKNIPLTHINNVSSEVLYALMKRCIELSILELGSPPSKFAWFTMGSLGRKEQLLLTDQDNFLIFEDVAPDKHKLVKDYFLQLAESTITKISKLGYSVSEDNLVASNPIWCKSITDWKKQFNNWLSAPDEKNDKVYTNFFDFDLVIGENSIEQEVLSFVYSLLKANTLFYDYLGNIALKNQQPLNFFKKFNVEEEGKHKNEFDIKNKAQKHYIDAARLFALSHSLKGINNTYMRFKQMSIIDQKNKDLYLNFAESYLVLSKIRTIEGIKNDSSGQYINLNELSKADKEKLRNALIPIRDLEDIIKDKYQLTQFS